MARITAALFALCLVMIAPALAQNNSKCRDTHKMCRVWSLRGECYLNAGFMHVHCPDTCGACKVNDHRCADHNTMCVGWSMVGECQRNKPYMEKKCPRACAFCVPANDHSVPHVHSNIVDRLWKSWQQNNPNLA